MRFQLILIAILALSTCRSGPPSDVSFDPADAALMDKPGKATIKGEAFLQYETGDANARYAAGKTVLLLPATRDARAQTDYVFQGAKFARASNLPTEDPDSDYRAHLRSTKADTKGRFTFENLPPGTYFGLEAGDLEAEKVLFQRRRADV